jgi:hypothetical protein
MRREVSLDTLLNEPYPSELTMLNYRQWMVAVLAVACPLPGAGQSAPLEEADKTRIGRPVTLLTLPPAKPGWAAGSPPAHRRYWSTATEQSSAAGAQDAQQAAQPSPPPAIADNSFLIEEAYNQEFGVVQHISTFSRAIAGGGWEYSFTQEWPWNPAPKSQLSYTLLAVSGGVPGAGGGMGDILLNYRYQLLGEGAEPVWFAPRASLLIPSGDSRRGRGAGGVGMQFNLPVSWQVADKWVTHWNAGATIVPRAQNEFGDQATTVGYFLGQSIIYQASPVFNLMLETLYDHAQRVTGASRVAWERGVILNPGLRWAHNFASGLQIVPGVAFPVQVSNSGRGNWGIFLYLSFEHPFGKRAP